MTIVLFNSTATATEGVSARLQFGVGSDQSTYYYQTRDGSAVAGSDYSPVSGTILPNRTDVISVPVLNDAIYENGTETVFVDLYQDVIRSNSSTVFGTTLTQTYVTRELVTSGIGTIVDDDAPPSVGLSSASLSIAEGNLGSTTDFVYTVTRATLSQQPQTVDYAVSGSGANPADASDFVNGQSSMAMTGTMAPTISMSPVVSGTVTFAPGETVQQITIQVRGDATIENDEQFTVYLTGSNFGSANGSATGTIQNDDVAVTPPPSGGGDPGPSTTPSSGPDQLTGTSGNDTIAGFSGSDSISGGDGNDLLYGNQDQDVIDAGSGDNTAYGGMGDDSITAGSGNDLLFGNEGSDTINAGDGNNTVVGGQDSTDGADRISAGAGNDLIFGNGGGDTISSTGGNDIVVGGYGNDVITLGAGNDIVYGNQDNDSIDVGDGANIVFGGMGDDYIKAGSGNDTLYGNEGNDTLSGGGGANRYVFGPAEGNDLVQGFSPADGDRLNLMGQTYVVTQDAQGSALLTLSGGGSITLFGVAASQVNPNFFTS